MSTFKVTVERIAEIRPHSNADRLEMARLSSMSFQFVVPKGEYSLDDLVVYFPLDSLIPAEIVEKLGLTGKLSGRDKNRVKTIRLRGEISQGVVSKVAPLLGETEVKEGDDLTEVLGVVKYEPAPVLDKAGTLIALPAGVSVYDIEGADRFPLVLEDLLDKRVMVTEKLEGSHFSATLSSTGLFTVCQRRYQIKPVEGAEHTWWKVASQQDIYGLLSSLLWKYDADIVTVRGEMVGPKIQNNIYGLTEHQLYLFEIEINGLPLSAREAFIWLKVYAANRYVPVLEKDIVLRDWLAGRTISEASNGMSLLNPAVIREGIVIRPLTEGYNEQIGRLIIKQRSPEYLAQEK